jgi:DNA-directed RNA polymerase specialized sigma24 family protein
LRPRRRLARFPILGLDAPVTRDRPAQVQTASPADELIERVARTADRAAFAGLFRLFAPRLKSYLIRQGCDIALAEELMQETMVMVWRRAASFDRRRAGVATWVFTIARNKRTDALRRQRRPEIDLEDPALAPDPPPSTEESVLAHERGAAWPGRSPHCPRNGRR